MQIPRSRYLIDALLLDPDHPRAGMKPDLKIWCQTHHAECLAQLAVFAPAREALLQHPSLIPALEAVGEAGLSAEARQFGQAALLALSDKELTALAEGEQKHVMVSCKVTSSSPLPVIYWSKLTGRRWLQTNGIISRQLSDSMNL